MKSKQKEILNIKRFGYVVSAILLILANIGLVNEWSVTPIIFIFTMYFLTGSLWAPNLIRIFYTHFGKYLFREDNSQPNKDRFSKN
jgi:hypothetical protein